MLNLSRGWFYACCGLLIAGILLPIGLMGYALTAVSALAAAPTLVLPDTVTPVIQHTATATATPVIQHTATATATPVIQHTATVTATPTGTPDLRSTFVDCATVANADSAPNSPVQIVAIDKQAETVTLLNVSDTAVDLTGWRMCSVAGGQRHGIEGTLSRGERKTFTNPSVSIWNNNTGDPGALWNAEGQLVSYWRD